MGIGPGYRCTSSPYSISGSNPNPKRFEIKGQARYRSEDGTSFLILDVYYPDALNFEGRKILLFRGYSTIEKLLAATGGELDPHFADEPWAPVARFAPTPLGRKYAATTVRALGGVLLRE